ncbi:hypothetical protein B0H13DRAFT_2262619 [Mycena leptocephala]|nr:hypothetical protein B0H13DRAFT_2262619 [Mycena leptocephala]
MHQMSGIDRHNFPASYLSFRRWRASPRFVLEDLLQQEWESWDSGTLQDQKLMYKKKWEIMRHAKRPIFPFQFRHIPRPTFRSGDRYPEISTPSVECFIFGETPPTKESKRLAKENLRLFHADKFDFYPWKESGLDTVPKQFAECSRDISINSNLY